jgi:hypothetical protein
MSQHPRLNGYRTIPREKSAVKVKTQFEPHNGP